MTKTISLFIFILFFSFHSEAQFSVRIQITDYLNIKDYRTESGLFVAGSFNSWNPNDSNYRMYGKPSGVYYTDLKLSKGMFEYKITRGNWSKVESKVDGSDIPNRILKIEGDTVVSITIGGWKDNFVKPNVSTASKNVKVIDTAFVIPQLKRIRRFWIYLPEDYATSRKHYPVLYMHDGQNVFDDTTSFSGEWGVDEFLDSTELNNCIVVAVDHGGSKRLNEYNPYDNERFGKGEGNEYVDFLVKTLKPVIDKTYHTLKDKENTFIAGSSMGGLISMYAVLKYPKVFGGVGVFSPSFWIGRTKLLDDIKTKGKKVNSKIYFYAGKQEDETMVPNMLKVFEMMNKVSKSKMVTVIRDDGKHNEARWRIEFPLFYKWASPL